jgi:hypothetical protein
MQNKPTRRGRVILAYAAPFLLLGLVAVVALNRHVFLEHWYCYKYERTHSSDYREDLEKLGGRHPELLLSRWFHLHSSKRPKNYRDQVRDLPPRVHLEAFGLLLQERFDGEWWRRAPPARYPLGLPEEPGPLGDRSCWLPHVPLLKDALERMPQPPPNSAVYGIDLYMASRALAICGHDTGLPHLEDMLLEDFNVYPYDPGGITDHLDAQVGIVALAAHGNWRARQILDKGLGRLRVRQGLAARMRALLKRKPDLPADNLKWLTERLGEHEHWRSQERERAGDRYAGFAPNVRKSSFLGCAVVTGRGADFFGTHMLAARLTCDGGTVFAEKLRVDHRGNWWLHRAQIPFEDYAALWKELLQFDIWNLPQEDDSGRRGCTTILFRAGKHIRRVARFTVHRGYRDPDCPSTWPHAWIQAYFEKSRVEPLTGKLDPRSRSKASDKLWLSGEAWPPANGPPPSSQDTREPQATAKPTGASYPQPLD